ncbi:hypothetical protein EAF00_004710 [Botryotinia globosa]|nr:hypothetical protein EAF00_004710 [Botryotinia globosa]
MSINFFLKNVNTSIGFFTHETERNFIFLRVIIPFDQVPDTIDSRSHSPDNFIIKLKFYANDMIGLSPSLFAPEGGFDENDPTTSGAIKLFSINKDDEEVFNGDNIEDIPAIVLKTPGFDRVGKKGEPKLKIWCLPFRS